MREVRELDWSLDPLIADRAAADLTPRLEHAQSVNGEDGTRTGMKRTTLTTRCDTAHATTTINAALLKECNS
jgi:hypothetical protein